ncbi:MAG: hypothetical protein LBU87_07220 [Lactobacillales bacterium]|jgi:hypothetical protein|nr:hypothetical protein [Lactobacillales bacterium]
MLKELRPYLNDFENELLDEIIKNYKNIESKINHCIFAFSLRGLLENFENRLASDAEVMKAPWYKKVSDERNVVRAQRYKYIIQGKYDDFFIKKIINFAEVEDYAKKLNKTLAKLSHRTHINEQVYHYTKKEKNDFVKEIEGSIIEFLRIFDEIKNKITEHMETYCSDVINDDEFISEALCAIDDIATHSRIDMQYVDDVEIVFPNNFPNHKNEDVFIAKVDGTIEVEHQIGSNSDLRRDDGLIFDSSYPYHLEFEFKIPLLSKILTEEIDEYSDDDIKNALKESIKLSFSVPSVNIDRSKHDNDFQ